MTAFLFDSSLYISALRAGNSGPPWLHETDDKTGVWLSSVVLEELYAGASNAKLAVIEEMEDLFDRRNRILVPNLADWVQTGKMLRRLAEKYGYEQIGRGRLTNDALIGASAARAGIRILTANRRDFARLAEFCPLSWQLVSC
jgi:predicted nucleic acid-binding protein